MVCQYCGNIHDGSYGSGRFCKQECSRGYSTKDKRKEINKKVSKKLKGKCFRIKKTYNCKICGSIIYYNRTLCSNYICRKKHQIFPTLIKYFNFNEKLLGTSNSIKEYNKIKNKLYIDIWINNLSIPDLCIKYNHNNIRNFWKILRTLEIDNRNYSQANYNSLVMKNRNIGSSPVYSQGWHTTWNNKIVYYRSSYELKYMKELDCKKINYEVEKIRIRYWDSEKNKYRIAIVDFYIPNENLLVEIKSSWTLDWQNMKDRKIAYLKNSYNFKLYLDFKETKI